jgi:hypothetical protein
MKNHWKSTSIIVAAVVSMALVVPAAASAAWGSIALNPQTGQAGVAFNEQTKNSAKTAAVKDCPGNCRAVLFVRNKCGAIARNDRRYTPGFGNSKSEAVKKAKKKARKGPGKVKLVAFVCSG